MPRLLEIHVRVVLEGFLLHEVTLGYPRGAGF